MKIQSIVEIFKVLVALKQALVHNLFKRSRLNLLLEDNYLWWEKRRERGYQKNYKEKKKKWKEEEQGTALVTLLDYLWKKLGHPNFAVPLSCLWYHQPVSGTSGKFGNWRQCITMILFLPIWVGPVSCYIEAIYLAFCIQSCSAPVVSLLFHLI